MMAPRVPEEKEIILLKGLNSLLHWPFSKFFWKNQHITTIEKTLLFALSKLLSPFIIDSPKRLAYLGLMQNYGVQAAPERYWEPIPQVSDIDKATTHIQNIGLKTLYSPWDPAIETLCHAPNAIQKFEDFMGPILKNPMFYNLDALVYPWVIEQYAPKRIIEIGSGYSAQVALKALSPEGHIHAIEPYPSEFLKQLAQEHPQRLQLIAQPIQESFHHPIFSTLKANDILFIDSTHICKMGGDLPVIFLKILPQLPKGVLIHFHDVSYPYEYPRVLAYDSGRMYNELYMVANLIENGPFEFLFGSYHFLVNRERWQNPEHYFNDGLSLWIKKK